MMTWLWGYLNCPRLRRYFYFTIAQWKGLAILWEILETPVTKWRKRGRNTRWESYFTVWPVTTNKFKNKMQCIEITEQPGHPYLCVYCECKRRWMFWETGYWWLLGKFEFVSDFCVDDVEFSVAIAQCLNLI